MTYKVNLPHVQTWLSLWSKLFFLPLHKLPIVVTSGYVKPHYLTIYCWPSFDDIYNFLILKSPLFTIIFLYLIYKNIQKFQNAYCPETLLTRTLKWLKFCWRPESPLEVTHLLVEIRHGLLWCSPCAGKNLGVFSNRTRKGWCRNTTRMPTPAGAGRKAKTIKCRGVLSPSLMSIWD